MLLATGHGSMIVNRNDFRMTGENTGYGVGWQLMTTSWCEPEEIELLGHLLRLRRKHYGDGVFAVDCGANIGTVTVSMATACAGWGLVLAFEPQERVFYALAGNVALNNCLNARVLNAAVGATDGELQVPAVDYLRPASFGSLEMRQRVETEDIGQPVDYGTTQPVRQYRLDSFGMTRLDLLKIDVEGMEFDVLAGADETIRACHPMLLIEHIKVDAERLFDQLRSWGYEVMPAGVNFVAVHSTDPCLQEMRKA
jgi:FkbM family methyltransferase